MHAFGVRVFIHPLYILLLAAAALGGYPRHAAVLFVSLVLHEMAHLVVARGLGLDVQAVELYPFGGVARLSITPGDTSEVTVAMAGPLQSLAVTGVLSALKSIPLWSGSVLEFAVEFNMYLGLVNLLPVLPLDGGRILRCLLGYSTGVSRATAILSAAGKIAGVLFCILGLAGLALSTVRPDLFTFGAFLFLAALKEGRYALLLDFQSLLSKKEYLRRRGLIPVRHIFVRPEMKVFDVIRSFSPKQYHVILVGEEELDVRGHLTEAELVRECVKQGLQIPIGRLL